MNRKNNLKKLAGLLGIASVSSLISVPVLAQMNAAPRSGNSFVAQQLDIAQNTPERMREGGSTETPGTMDAPASETEAPGTMRRQDGGINTPGTMDAPDAPAGEMTTPDGMRQRDGVNTPGTMERQGEGTNTPGTMQRQGEGTNTPGTMQRQGEGTNTPGTMQRQGEGTNTPGTMNAPERMRRQGGSPDSSGTMNAPTRGTNNPASGNSQTSLSAADRDFIMKAAQDSMAEIQLGQLATEKATTDAVRQFGQMMIEHHTQANQELTQLASQKGLTLPTDMGEENRARMERLSQLSGREFDSAYMQEMVKAHAKDVSLFQSQTQQGQAQDVKAWAANKLPLLEEHLQMARNMTPEG